MKKVQECIEEPFICSSSLTRPSSGEVFLELVARGHFIPDASDMHPLVRDLCKRLVLAARRHPSGEVWFKERAMDALQRNALLSSEEDIRRAVARGRRAVRDAEEFSRFSRYRAMRKRYSNSNVGVPSNS